MSKIDEIQAKLDRLEARKLALKAKAKAALSREKSEERKRENQKKLLTGAMILHLVESGQGQEEWLKERMDSFLRMPAGKEPTDKAIKI
jgi:hypothetical protein